MKLLDLPEDTLWLIATKVRYDTLGLRYLLRQLKDDAKSVLDHVVDVEDSIEGKFYRCVKYVLRFYKVNNRLGIQEMLVKLNGFEYWMDYTKQTGVFQVLKYKATTGNHLGFIRRVAKGTMKDGVLQDLEHTAGERLCMVYMGVAFGLVCSLKGKINIHNACRYVQSMTKQLPPA